MELTVRPHLMSPKTVTREVTVGDSIQQAVDTLHEIDSRVRQLNLCVLIDGVPLPQAEWATTYITAGNRYSVNAVLKGGDGDKQILMLIAVIALSMIAGPAAAALVGSSEGGMFLAVKAGIMMVGSMAISSVFAPPKADVQSSAKVSRAYTFSGQANAVRRFEVLPRVYGRHRVVPDVAALPYTVQFGDDSYMYCLYSFGYGPLRLEDFRIGQNPLTNYQDCEIVVHESLTDENDLKLYRSDVWQDSLNLEITYGTPVIATTQVDIDTATIDVIFTSGLGYVNDSGAVLLRSTQMLLEYRLAGTSDPWGKIPTWTIDQGATGVSQGSFGAKLVAQLDASDVVGRAVKGLAKGRTVFNVSSWGTLGTENPDARPGPGDVVTIAQYSVTVLSVVGGVVTLSTPLPGNAFGSNAIDSKVDMTFYTTVEVEVGGVPLETDGMWQIQRARKGGFIVTANLRFPSKDQWEIRISKLDADPTTEEQEQSRHLWARTLVAIKSFKQVLPINPEVPMTFVELKIKATGQLNGSVEQFNAIAVSILNVWNGTSFDLEETRNPAWAFLDVLRGTANRRPLSDSRIDLAGLLAWATSCDSVDAPFTEAMGTCDIVLDRDYTVWEVLQSIATTGRATPTIRDNKYGVLLDSSDRTAVQMFTPRNSSNLRSSRSYIDQPHALRMKWIDPDASYNIAELVVYSPDYDAESSTRFEELVTFGMTRSDQVLRYGRYMLAQGRLRLERFELDADIENIVCMRGDLIAVAHDVIGVGGGMYARIAEIDGFVITLDVPFAAIPVAVDTGVRIRQQDGQLTGVLEVTATGVDTVTMDSLTAVMGDYNVGDLIVVGQKTQTVGYYTVDYVRPGQDLAATIGLEEYAPAVYDAEFTGVIPDYVPQGGNSYIMSPPTALNVELTIFFEGIQPTASVVITWMPPSGTPVQPDWYQVFYVDPGGSEVLIGQTKGLLFVSPSFGISGLSGYTAVIHVRAVYLGGESENAVDTVTFPNIDHRKPENIDLFSVEDVPGGLRRYNIGFSSGVVPVDVVGVDIRYVVGTVAHDDLVFATMTPVVSGSNRFFTASGRELATPFDSGPFTFAAKTVNRFLDESDTWVSYQVTLSQSLAEAGEEAADLTPPPAPTGFAVVPGVELITLTTDVPAFTEGRGYHHTRVYFAPDVGSPVYPDDAVYALDIYGPSISIALPGGSFRVWVTWVTVNGIEGPAAGGTGGLAAAPTSADLTPPPAPTGLYAASGLETVTVGTDQPTFTEGRGYHHTRLYAALDVGSPVYPDDANYILDFFGPLITSSIPPEEYRVWATWVTNNGVEGPAAGGAGGVALSVEGTLSTAKLAIEAATIPRGSVTSSDTTITLTATDYEILFVTLTTDTIEAPSKVSVEANVYVDPASGSPTDEDTLTLKLIRQIDAGSPSTVTSVEVTVDGSKSYSFPISYYDTGLSLSSVYRYSVAVSRSGSPVGAAVVVSGAVLSTEGYLR